ncbi:MAG: cell division protein FtsQ/DivIB [Alphaproteobacteria bacterium]
MLPVTQYNDPSPSRARYRFERIWLKPSVRKFVRVWLPVLLLSGAVISAANNPAVQQSMQDGLTSLRITVAERPELQITTVDFMEISDDLQQQILAVTGLELPISSLDLDVVRIKEIVEQLDAVKAVEVRVHSDGTLQINAVERQPTMVWRDQDALRLIDNEGNRVAIIARRSARGDLPLIVGEGAELAVNEVNELLQVAAPIAERLRGFVRVGERRWDVVLDRGQTVMLPETGAVTALRRVIALHQAQDLLNRDVSVIDFRNGERPVLRLTETAISELRRLRTLVRGEDA